MQIVASSVSSPKNLILAALPQGEMRIFSERGEKVYLPQGMVVQDSGASVESLFFPTTAVISLMALTRDGFSVESGLVCQEGMVGLSYMFGRQTQPLECVVQKSGEACRMSATLMREARLSALQTLLFHYSNYRIAELAQLAICNTFHVLRQRFSRWLLTVQDRTGLDRLEFTQEFLSTMVGARRPVVSALLRRLQREGLIEYGRGGIAILDRSRLEASTCECYGLIARAMQEYVLALQNPAAPDA
jgi:CRP-like cAMP-binding protein